MVETEWLQALCELEEELGQGEVRGAGPERLRALRVEIAARERHVRELRAEKDELLSTVAHDLRTPLVAIQGFVQLLELSADKFGLADKQREYVQRICQAAQQMNRLVDDLRIARQLEEGRLSIRPATVNLGAFLGDVLGLQREAARPRGVAVEVLPSQKIPPTAVFDPERIAQALGNLVQNAVRVTQGGQRVEIELVASGGRLSFQVRDRGPGIDPEELPQLFERFAQGRRERTEGRGSGLGLYICREMAALHGGRVTAHNRPRGGAEFCLELPLVTVDTGEAQDTEGSREGAQ